MLGLLGKILAEAIVTLYTVVVRTSSFSPLTQSAFRSLFIPLALLPFVGGIGKYIFTPSWIGIGVVNLLHIISSFEGFKILPTGPAVTLYFTYPLMAIFLAYIFLGRTITYRSLIGIACAIIGVVLMNYRRTETDQGDVVVGNGDVSMNLVGVLWILLSAFTEAILYLFIISGGAVYNNYLFTVVALYFWAGVVAFMYLLYISLPQKREEPSPSSEPSVFSYDTLYILAINLALGVGGMTLQHGTARVLPTGSYASLSYTGIFFAYVYGLLLGDGIQWNDIIASILIIGGSLFGGLS